MNINYISTDKQSAISSIGELFKVGEKTRHQHNEAGTATIQSFEVDEKQNEVEAYTDKGMAHLDFLVKLSYER